MHRLTLVAVAAILVLSSPVSASITPEKWVGWEKTCNRYADKAMGAVFANDIGQCGGAGDNWSNNRADHYNWCMNLKGQMSRPAAAKLLKHESSVRSKVIGFAQCG